MQAYAVWWILAAVLVGVELASGTFYLLVYGMAAAVAGVAAWLGAGMVAQLLPAAVIGAVGTLMLRRWKRNTDRPEFSVQDMDIGKTVQIESWQGDRGQVKYRGAVWDAEAEPAGVDSTRPLVIRAIKGNTLVLGNLSGEQFMDAVALVIVIVIAIVGAKGVRVVPQQNAWVVERLGKFHAVLVPGLNLVIPFIDTVAYKHSLKEIPLDVPSQVCITRDNTQLAVDGILYFQVTDPKMASYGSSDYISAISQLAQTTLRSLIGRMEMARTFEEREEITRGVVMALNEASTNWGVKVLRYEITDLTPPKDILHAMQRQITAEREKRALIASSEGRMQEQINIATGEREAAIQQSEGDKQAAINVAMGEAEAIKAIAVANAEAIARVARAIEMPGGIQAVNLKVAEKYVEAFSGLAKTGNTLIVPSNMADLSSLIAGAMSVVKSQTPERVNQA